MELRGNLTGGEWHTGRTGNALCRGESYWWELKKGVVLKEVGIKGGNLTGGDGLLELGMQGRILLVGALGGCCTGRNGNEGVKLTCWGAIEGCHSRELGMGWLYWAGCKITLQNWGHWRIILNEEQYK